MPEWYLVIFMLAFTVLMGPLWTPLYCGWLLLALAMGIPVIQALHNGRRVQISHSRRTLPVRCAMRALIALLYLLQPLARLRGRIGAGLTPWRRRHGQRFALPGFHTLTIWSEAWHSPIEWLPEAQALT